MGETALKIKGLTKKYSNHAVLDKIDITLEEKHICALIGDQGSGKTTLVRCIGGLCRPDEGEIEILGNPMRDLTISRREVGMLIDQPVFYNDLSIMNNLKMQGKVLGGVERKRIVALMKALKITPRETGSRVVGGCPAGIKLNLSIALALLGSPRLLILDELYNGMDNDGALLVRELIKQEMNERPMTVIMTGQFFAELYPTATDFIFIDKGKIIHRMTREEIDSCLPSDIKKASEYETFYKQLIREIKY